MLTRVGGLQDAQTNAAGSEVSANMGFDPPPPSHWHALQQIRHSLGPDEHLLVVCFQSKGLSTLWEEKLIWSRWEKTGQQRALMRSWEQAEAGRYWREGQAVTSLALLIRVFQSNTKIPSVKNFLTTTVDREIKELKKIKYCSSSLSHSSSLALILRHYLSSEIPVCYSRTGLHIKNGKQPDANWDVLLDVVYTCTGLPRHRSLFGYHSRCPLSTDGDVCWFCLGNISWLNLEVRLRSLLLAQSGAGHQTLHTVDCNYRKELGLTWQPLNWKDKW